MLFSMTGFGGAKTDVDGISLTSEIKTVNNRFFKLSLKISDGFSAFEPKIESFLKNHIDRGTVSLTLRIVDNDDLSDFCFNIDVLERYICDAERFCRRHETSALSLGTVADFMRLPNVLRDNSSEPSSEKLERYWNLVVQNLEVALTRLQEMRRKEGEQMSLNLCDNCQKLDDLIEKVAKFAPQVVENYRRRLTERISKIMSDQELTFSPADLVREIAIFTDKADVSEEIVRFRSHLKQFVAATTQESRCGKKLDFLTQELLRETNTIGSKANSSEITNFVIEMKAIIERIREMVQNVE